MSSIPKLPMELEDLALDYFLNWFDGLRAALLGSWMLVWVLRWLRHGATTMSQNRLDRKSAYVLDRFST